MPPIYDNDWTEIAQSEDPAIQTLQSLGYLFVDANQLTSERTSLAHCILSQRLAYAIKKLNPWISNDNIHKTLRAVSDPQATSVIEANQKIHSHLTHGITVEQDLGKGKTSHDVRVIDFDHPLENEFLVTRQLVIKGSSKHIKPDIVVFINGIPLALIECKNPVLGDEWKEEAVRQLLRYQEIGEEFKNLGAPRVFETIQLVAAMCGQAACFGTAGTPLRFFSEWKEPYPLSLQSLEQKLGHTPTPQEVLLHGMFEPGNFLDILRDFCVFDVDGSSLVRKICRYQQFGAVHKALKRIREAKLPQERGGVIWHTQGSGKSLTMLWLALKLRRDPMLQNPTLVFVTDRVDLDHQLTKTFQACGFPNPIQAKSVRDLHYLLSGPNGQTILTTIHKFQELGASLGASKAGLGAADFPVLSNAMNLFVMTDEAHRTQYGGLALQMRKALPNACFFGFSGTPIDKQDRSTPRTFGPYIDTYTIQQSVADGATVDIHYESRLPELRIVGNTLDQLFERVFAARSKEEREAIKSKYATEAAIAAAPRRIEAICLDLIEHFGQRIQPNGFKAQIVTHSRETAALYKETLDRLNGPVSVVIFSGTHNDTANLAKHHTTDQQRKALIDRFLNRADPLSVLIVCDMLITGFDAPVEQVMYLDAPLREHTLLQAIARVNRPAEGKDLGLVVDYWGVSEQLQEALAIFAPGDIRNAMTPLEDEFPRLEIRHGVVMRFFMGVRNKDDLNQCVAVLEPEDTRSEFNLAFRRFARSLDMLMPDPRVASYLDDMRWAGKIRQAAAARFRDKKLDISDCGAKVKKLIEDAVVALGIQILVKQVSLFSSEMDQKLLALNDNDARASEMEHALKDEIQQRHEENPAFYTSLRERLERIIDDRKAKRTDAAKQLELLSVLRREIGEQAEAAARLGLSGAGFAIYGLLRRDKGGGGEVDNGDRKLALLVEEAVGEQTKLLDWQEKDDVRREMQRQVKRLLLAANVPDDRADALSGSVVELMRARSRG